MIQVTDEFKNAWLNGHQKHIQLDFSDNTSLSDEDIVLESQSLEQSLCTEEQLVFGMTSASCYKISVFNTGKKYKGLKVSPMIAAIDDDNQYYIMNLGEYTIESDVRTDDRKYRELTAYDPLYGILNRNYIAWYKIFFSNTSVVHTIKEFRDAFFTQIGIQQTTVSLVNDNAPIYYNSSIDTFSGADIIRCICEPNAAFGFINYEGKFQYVLPTTVGGFYPADDIYPADDLYPGDAADELLKPGDVDSSPNSVVYNDYYTHRISQARFVATEHTAEVVVGTSPDNCYQFGLNPLLYFCNETELTAIATNFLDIVKNFFYTPAKIRSRTRLWLQLGDVLSYTDGTHSAIIPIMQRKMTGITAFYDEYSANGKEYYTYSVNSYSTVVEAVADQKVKFDGMVTFADLATEGETVINGSNIVTGKITSIEFDNGNGTFKVTAEGVVTASNVNITGGTLKIGTQFEVSKTGVVTASSGKIGYWRFDNTYGLWNDGGQSSLSFPDEGSPRLYVNGSTGTLYGGLNLYLSALRSISASHSIVVVSDERIKENVKELDEFEDVFMKLKPCSYHMKTRDDATRSIGFKAQEVVKAMDDGGISHDDYGIVQEFATDERAKPYIETDTMYGVRYEDFIALNTHMIQKQQKKIEELEKEIMELKNAIQKLTR